MRKAERTMSDSRQGPLLACSLSTRAKPSTSSRSRIGTPWNRLDAPSDCAAATRGPKANTAVLHGRRKLEAKGVGKHHRCDAAACADQRLCNLRRACQAALGHLEAARPQLCSGCLVERQQHPTFE